MKHTIYALVDPGTLQVRYVGKTGQKPSRRDPTTLAQRDEMQKPVYNWIRALAPQQPILVILQEVDYVKSGPRRWDVREQHKYGGN